MKRILLILVLSAFVFPGMGQQQMPKRAKKHTPALSAFRTSAKENTKEKEMEISPISFLEWGTLGIKNKAQADSSLMYVNTGFKSDGMVLLAKEIPVYYDGTFNIKELERWYSDEATKDYYPAEKQAAYYDNDDNLVRVESYLWDTDQWMPYFATEMGTDKAGEEVLYVEYVYNYDVSEWEVDYGYRATDEMNENDQLLVRIWEYYDSWTRSWITEEREEYFYNNDNAMTEVLFSWYDEMEDSWEPETRMVFEPGENNDWNSGYSWEWDWIEEQWIKSLKYFDIKWYNYDLLQFTDMTVLVNPEVMEEIDVFNKGYTGDEIDWLNFMRMAATYNEEGRMILIQQEIWDYEQEKWIGSYKTEWDYDAFRNLSYYAFSIDNGEGWEIIEGASAKFEYNEDQSVKKIDVYILEGGTWTNEFDHFLRFDLYYTEDVTEVPHIAGAAKLQVYPNPVNSGLQMVWGNSDDTLDVTIVSMDGKIVSQYNQYSVSAGIPVSFDVSHLQNGVYILRCQGKTGTSVARFVKK